MARNREHHDRSPFRSTSFSGHASRPISGTKRHAPRVSKENAEVVLLTLVSSWDSLDPTGMTSLPPVVS